MVGFTSQGLGGRSLAWRIAILVLGLTAIMVVGASATYTDTFTSCPWTGG